MPEINANSTTPVTAGLSVLVPCYNEAAGLPGTIAQLAQTLAEMFDAHAIPWEIIVVDDGSTDGTATAAEALRETANLRVVRHASNRGYGAALKTGGAAARYALLAIIDADGTYPVARLKDLHAALGDNTMVVAARTGANVQIPWVRKPAKWVLNRLADYLTGIHIPDLNSGMRIIRRDLWQRYERFFPNGFSLTTTITLAALTNGHPVAYVPIDYHARIGSSKIRPIHDTIEFTRLILRTVLYFDPMKVFLPLSMIFLALSLLVGFGTLIMAHVFHEGEFMDVTTVLLFIAAIQTLAIGALADLITKRLS